MGHLHACAQVPALCTRALALPASSLTASTHCPDSRDFCLRSAGRPRRDAQGSSCTPVCRHGAAHCSRCSSNHCLANRLLACAIQARQGARSAQALVQANVRWRKPTTSSRLRYVWLNHRFGTRAPQFLKDRKFGSESAEPSIFRPNSARIRPNLNRNQPVSAKFGPESFRVGGNTRTRVVVQLMGPAGRPTCMLYGDAIV